jgi:predicted permease
MPITMLPVLSPDGGDYFNRTPGEVLYWTWAMGRLRAGITVEQARANIDALGAYLAENFAEWNEGEGATVAQHSGFHPPSRATLVTMTRLLVVVAALVLVIASANIAILLLARGSARRREVGVRFALGARRSRVIRQLVTESLMLGAAGGLVGFAVAFWSADLAATMIPLSFAVDFTPDWTVLGFAVAIAVGSGALFGVIPALQASRADAAVVIKEATPGGGRSVLRDSLVVLQVALSVVLVTGAALFGRSLGNAQSVEIGFASEDRLVVGVRLQNHGYDAERGVEFIRQALERLPAVPGVRQVSAAYMLPFRGSWGGSFEAPGVAPPDGNTGFESGFNRVGAKYFETMEIPLVTGRGFTMQDDGRAPSVTVVNEAVAAMLWPGQEAVGRTISRGDVTSTVIGVARNATYYELGEDPRPQIYFPYLQNYGSSVNFIVHVAGAPSAMLRTLQDELHLVDPSVAFARVSTIDEGLESQIGQYRVSATLVSLFGFLALVLASVGLYGVLSYLVVQSKRQIGIQLALGATTTQVGRLVVGRGVKLALVGIALGTGVAFATTRLVSSQLYGLNPRDPVTFVAVPLLLIVVACVASIVPAGRAARVDPMVALKGE